jgi:glycosyltransferase involved in cell wall biosynthesis
MWAQKQLFDRAVARERLSSADAVVAFPGASARTFGTHRSLVRVLHQVDAHPEAHNERLLRFYPRRRVIAELYPSSVVERIQEEIEAASLVLCPSRLVIEQFRSRGVDAGKLRLLPYGVDTATFVPREADRGRAPRPSVVFVGQVSLRKGIPYLLEAARGLDLDVHLVGGVFDRRLVASAPPNVRIHGRVSGANLPAVFAACDALVLPSVEDSFGLVTTEAAACGLQVITTSASGASELECLTDRVVPPGDVTALRSALREVRPLSLPQRWDRRERLEADKALVDWSTYGTAALRVIGRELAGSSA